MHHLHPKVTVKLPRRTRARRFGRPPSTTCQQETEVPGAPVHRTATPGASVRHLVDVPFDLHRVWGRIEGFVVSLHDFAQDSEFIPPCPDGDSLRLSCVVDLHISELCQAASSSAGEQRFLIWLPSGERLTDPRPGHDGTRSRRRRPDDARPGARTRTMWHPNACPDQGLYYASPLLLNTRTDVACTLRRWAKRSGTSP